MGFSVGVCIAALGLRGDGFNFREVHSTKSYKHDWYDIYGANNRRDL